MRRREEEKIRTESQHLVKIKFEVSGQADNLKQRQYFLDTEDDRHPAQKGGSTNTVSPLLRVHCSHMLSSQSTDDGGPKTLGATPLRQVQEPFRVESTSLTAPSIDLPFNTTVSARPENEILSVGVSSGAPPLPSPDNDSSDACDVWPFQEKDIPLVEDFAPSAEVIMDDPALSIMSSVISASPDWPPPNQLAGHQLQLEGSTEVHRDDFFDDNAHNEKDGTMMYSLDQCSSLRAAFCTDVAAETDVDHLFVKEKPSSPVLLPSDPEDTSVLEPICSLDGTGLLYESPLETNGCLNPSLSEWIGSDDWVEE